MHLSYGKNNKVRGKQEVKLDIATEHAVEASVCHCKIRDVP